MAKKIKEVEDICTAKVRQKILLSLYGGKKTNTELCGAVYLKNEESPDNISQELKKINTNYVDKVGSYHVLTPIGKLLASNLLVYCSVVKKTNLAFKVINQYYGFWDNHFLGGIPESSLNCIGDLCKSKLMENKRGGPDIVYDNYLKNLKTAKKVFIVSALTSVKQINDLTERLSEGVIIEFVHSNDVSEIPNTEDYKKKREEIIKNPKFISMFTTDEYLFSWNKIPGEDSPIFKDFLEKNYGIDWVITDKFEKSADGKTITVSYKYNELTLTLYEENRVELKTGKLFDVFIARKESENLKIYKDNIKIGLTVADNFLSFGLYHKNKSGYDTETDLFSEDEKAIKWGMRLFQYHKARSTPAPFR